MTMHVNLSPEMETFIKGKVAAGFYGNATEVVRDAMRRMQTEEERRTAFRAAVEAGDAELDRGEGKEYTPQTMAQIAERARKAIGSKEPMNPDVLP